MTLTNKDIAKLKIAFAIDDYYYNKDSKSYFDKMPLIDLADSQTIFVNEYLQIIKNKDISNDFERLLFAMKRENDNFRKLLKANPTNSYYKKEYTSPWLYHQDDGKIQKNILKNKFY